jgi:hypothetical protein
VISGVERAIYGLLGGNIQAVYPQCKTWYDWCWAYFKKMVDDSHDNALFAELTARGDTPETTLPSSSPLTRPEQVFAALKEAERPNIK